MILPARLSLSQPEAFFLRACLRAECWLPADLTWQYRFGPYTMDAAVPSLSLDVELDGWRHATSKGRDRDARRSTYIGRCGWRIFRFTSRDVCDNVRVYTKVDKYYPGWKADQCVWALLTVLGLPAPMPHELKKPVAVPAVLMANKPTTSVPNTPPFHAESWPGVNGW